VGGKFACYEGRRKGGRGEIWLMGDRVLSNRGHGWRALVSFGGEARGKWLTKQERENPRRTLPVITKNE